MQTYSASARLSAIPGIPENVFYETRNLLEENGGLSFSIGHIRGEGCSGNGAVAILRHILMRTLRFRKLFEHIRVDEIVAGMPEHGIAPANLCDRQVRRNLNTLVRLGYVAEFEADCGRAKFLGLNLPFIIGRLRDTWRDVQFTTNEGPARVRRLEMAIGVFCDRLSGFYGAIRFKPVRSWDDFLGDLGDSFGGIMTDASEETETNSSLGDERLGARAGDFGGELFGSEAGLRTWRGVVLETNRYPGFIVETSHKARNMMMNYLAELRKNGLTRDGIHEHFRWAARNWHRIAGMRFTTDRHKRCIVQDTPNFGFYYMFRRQIDSLIRNQEARASVSQLDKVAF